MSSYIIGFSQLGVGALQIRQGGLGLALLEQHPAHAVLDFGRIGTAAQGSLDVAACLSQVGIGQGEHGVAEGIEDVGIFGHEFLCLFEVGYGFLGLLQAVGIQDGALLEDEGEHGGRCGVVAVAAVEAAQTI